MLIEHKIGWMNNLKICELLLVMDSFIIKHGPYNPLPAELLCLY